MSGGKECSFFGKFGVLCFLVTPVFSYAFLVSPVLPTNVPIYVTEAQRICNYLGFNIRGLLLMIKDCCNIQDGALCDNS